MNSNCIQMVYFGNSLDMWKVGEIV
jgi:hypothetical protein